MTLFSSPSYTTMPSNRACSFATNTHPTGRTVYLPVPFSLILFVSTSFFLQPFLRHLPLRYTWLSFHHSGFHKVSVNLPCSRHCYHHAYTMKFSVHSQFPLERPRYENSLIEASIFPLRKHVEPIGMGAWAAVWLRWMWSGGGAMRVVMSFLWMSDSLPFMFATMRLLLTCSSRMYCSTFCLVFECE
ncbi:hypothetical protein CPB85DRAFT_451109 [Mucidula mucida]|nr:hypothetical protein CPB85DRAFT_451109 [Mucidula mucida]